MQVANPALIKIVTISTYPRQTFVKPLCNIEA
jgi:hypothetical protein